MSETSTIESMIWNIADYARDAIDRKDYNKIVLPFSLLRRLECALEPTRDAVVAKYEEKKNEWGDEDDKYCTVSGYSFYNISPIRLKTIGNQTLAAMKTYVESFSPNVREIFQAFDFESVCSKLDNKNLLYEVCKKFSAIDLGTDVVSDRDMTNIYEHLIQKFGDEIAEDAEDFMTPRDIVRLSVNMLFANEEDILEADKGNVRTLYDQTCGTCGFISDALDQIEEWKTSNKLKHPTVIVPYGQEINDTTWAMGKAALLLRNVSNDDNDIYDQTKDLSEHILKGDTLNDDQFGGQTFDFQLLKLNTRMSVMNMTDTDTWADSAQVFLLWMMALCFSCRMQSPRCVRQKKAAARSALSCRHRLSLQASPAVPRLTSADGFCRMTTLTA